MNHKELNITEGPVFKNLLFFTIPLILAGILQILYTSADIIVVGRFAGSDSLAAVGSTASLINLLTNLFIGLSTGTAVCVAHFIGSNETEALQKSVHTSVCIAVSGGLILTAVCAPLSKLFLSLMHTPADIIDEAAFYMRIIFAGMPASMLYNFGSAILRSSGNTKTPLIILTTAGAVNIVLNLIFVIVFDMGAEGVGFATIISQTISAVWVIMILMKLDNNCRLHINKIRIDKHMLIKILKIGFPAGLQGVIFSLSNTLIQSSINGFGSNAVAGSTAAANIEDFCYVAMNSMHQSVLTFTGQNIGAGKPHRIKNIVKTGCLQITAIGIMIEALILIFAHPMLNLYSPGDENVIAYGIIRLTYCLPLYFLYGIIDTLAGALRGMGASVQPTAISIIGICGIRIIWIYTIFRKIKKYEILLLCYPVSWIITVFMQLIFVIIVLKKILNNNNKTIESA